jgi:hypothetical protein
MFLDDGQNPNRWRYFSSCSRSSRSRGRVHSPSHGPIPTCNAPSGVLLLPGWSETPPLQPTGFVFIGPLCRWITQVALAVAFYISRCRRYTRTLDEE